MNILNTDSPSNTPVRLIDGPNHYFFGYYDKCCWDASGRWILAQESTFMDRPPTASGDDKIAIGVIDTQNGYAWKPLAETRAWNWQQGSMLQWLNGGPEIIFNDRSPDGFISRIINIETGSERTIPTPVYAVNASGTYAISLNFSRLHHQRPGYGYPGVPDQWEKISEPKDDGLYRVDLKSGDSQLILSLKEIAEWDRPADSRGKMHRFNHVQFGPNNDRFAFLHRYKSPEEEVGSTRLFTANLDGGDLHCLSDHKLVSHYDWRGAEGILAWANRHGNGPNYYYFKDKTNEVNTIGTDVLDCDGHCSFSPDRRWVLTDTYPDETHHRTLILYHWASGTRIDIGRFFAPPMEWQIRCDLHPRWNRDGTKICIDSIHEGKRNMYLLDVRDIVYSL